MPAYSYFATFHEPKPGSALNLMGLKVPVDVEVEVYYSRRLWVAQEVTTQRPLPTEPAMSAEQQMKDVEGLYSTKKKEWERRWSTTHLAVSEFQPSRSACGRKIDPTSVVSSNPNCAQCRRIEQRDLCQNV